MNQRIILVIDNNSLITKSFKEFFVQYVPINRDNIKILPDDEYNSKDKIEDLLVQEAHKYSVLINANCSFSKTIGPISYDGIHLLQRVYENACDYEINVKPMVTSFQSLRHLKSVHDPLCRILLENDQLYCFTQLPVAVHSLDEYFDNWRSQI